MNMHADLPLELSRLLNPTNSELYHCTLSLRFLEGQILMQRRDPKTGAQVDCFISPQDAADCFLRAPSDSGWLRSSVIRHGRHSGCSWVVVYEKPQKRQLQLACDDRFSPVLGEPFVEVHIPFPGLCCFLSGASAWGWALKGKSFQSRSVAYTLPLPNSSTEGLMCFGAQEHPLVGVHNAKQVLDIWLSGTFNGHQISHKCHTQEPDIRHLLWDIHQRQPKQFPSDELVSNQSIEQMIRYRLNHL